VAFRRRTIEDQTMDRHVSFERLHNVRDLGGYRTANGDRVITGVVYRADSLGKLRGADWEKFLGLGVQTVIDLRYPWEIESKGQVPEAARFRYYNLSIEHRPYDQATIDPELDPWRFLADRFAEVIEDGAVEIRQVIEHLATAPGPVVFHCTSGKDRTGLIAALTLTLLGVPRPEVLADFALTELATERLVADWRAANPERELLWPSYGRAPATIMELVLADLEARYGSVEGYLKNTAGLSDDTVVQLRKRLLVRSDPDDLAREPGPSMSSLHIAVTGLVVGLTPHDELARQHRAQTLDWLASTGDIFRRVKPAVPSPHLVSYFLLIDRAAASVLLCDHRLARLWLPTGGHVEPMEHPYATVRRECVEELGTPAVPDGPWGVNPFLLTVTQTRDTPERRHTDVSLWFALSGRVGQELSIDEREFADVRWWTAAEVREADPARFDPHVVRALDVLGL
jgi:protein-tyrosine phosphatase